MENTKIFSGTANKPLAEAVCEYLNVSPGKLETRRFSDGEVFAEIDESVRKKDTFVIQPTCPPVNENLMELLIIIDALKRASAGSISAVIPYYGYARQDRKVLPRAPITSKLIADILVIAGINRVVTVDLHAGQIQGFFTVPVDHLYGSPVIYDYLKEKYEDEDLVIVSPDAGGMERARKYANYLGAELAMADKRRTAPNVAEISYVIGDVKGKTAIIVDDIVDTAGTTTLAAKILMAEGAKSVSLCCTHGVLSGPAIDRINNSDFDEVIITDSIPQQKNIQECEKIRVLSLASMLGESIKRISSGESISSLFN